MAKDAEIDKIEVQRKRLRFRAWHRGTREMDLILGQFADETLHQLDADALQAFERLLNNSDPDLYNWLSGKEPVPPAEDNSVMRLFVNSAR